MRFRWNPIGSRVGVLHNPLPAAVSEAYYICPRRPGPADALTRPRYPSVATIDFLQPVGGVGGCLLGFLLGRVNERFVSKVCVSRTASPDPKVGESVRGLDSYHTSTVFAKAFRRVASEFNVGRTAYYEHSYPVCRCTNEVVSTGSRMPSL